MNMENLESSAFIEDPNKQEPNNGSTATIAGILLILAGVLAILAGVSILLIDTSIIESSMISVQEVDPSITPEMIRSILVVCGTILSIIAIFPLLGGIFALKRKMWGIAVAGSIIGIFSIGPIFASSVMSLVALILLFKSKNEFS